MGKKTRKGRRAAAGSNLISQLVAGSTAMDAYAQALKEARGKKKTKKRPFNLIYIGTDTWRADHLGCYGNDWIRTPYLDQFASEGVSFKNAYADDLPTIPTRRVIYTGKSIIPMWEHGGWRPLFEDDITFAQTVAVQGFTTGLIADCYHFFKPDMNLHRGFASWEWIRGQEFDLWKSGPTEQFNTRDHLPKNLWEEGQNLAVLRYMMNTQDIRTEEDYFCARTCRAAMEWLERNTGGKPFTLWLEMFDPHEPWDAPKRFQEMYYDRYPVERFLYGYGVDPKDLTESDIEALRGLYAAEVTFTDMWIGRLLQKVNDLGLLDDTVIVFSTDHGTHIGEKGCVHKTGGYLNSMVAQVPLIIRHPDTDKYAGKSVDELVSVVDYMPTLLDLLGATPISKMDGASFWPIVDGKVESTHDEIFTGFGVFGAVRTKEWHYFENVLQIGTPKSRKIDGHGLANSEHAKDKGHGPCLYDLTEDRGETKNVYRKHPDVVKKMRRLLAKKFNVRMHK